MSNIVDTLQQFFTQSKEETKNQTPEGLCPNCWGKQEYDNQIREIFEDKQIDVNNGESRYSFIQDFVVTHIEGIKLKAGNNSLECPTCKAKY